MNENPLFAALSVFSLIAFAIFLLVTAFRKTVRAVNLYLFSEPEPSFKTRNVKKLRPGTEFIVIDLRGKLPVVQKIEDYQESLATKNGFKNLFYLSRCGKHYLKEFKTYIIEKHPSNHSTFLRPTTRMITSDGGFG